MWEPLSQPRRSLRKGEAESWLNRAHRVHRVTQDRLVNTSRGSNAPGGIVRSLLKQVADVTARPFPVNFVSTGGAVQTLPPRQIGFAAKASAHRLDDITRVRKQLHIARFAQRFESNGCRHNLRLLIRGAAQVFADGAPESLVSQERDSSRAARFLSVAKTRSVAKNFYLLESCHRYRLLFCKIFCIGERPRRTKRCLKLIEFAISFAVLSTVRPGMDHQSWPYSKE